MWQLGPHTNRFEVERILKEREERLFENPKSRTTVRAHVDGTSWLDPERVETWGDLVPALGPLTLTQQFEQYLGDDTIGFLDLEMLNAHGRGTGSLVGRVRSLLSTKSQLEVSLGLGSKKYVGYTWQYMVTPGTMLGFTMQGNYYGGVLRPSYQVAVNQVLTDNSRISLVAAQGGTFAASLAAGPFSLNIQMMPNNNYFVRLRHNLELNSLLTCRFKMESSSQEGVLASVGLVKELPSLSGQVGVDLQAGGYLGGVVLKVHLNRFDYRLVVPLHLSYELSLEALLLGSIIPSLSCFVFDTFLLRPFRKRKEQKKWRELLSKSKHLWEQKREEAEIVRELLNETAERKRLQEESSNGLVIRKATYREIGGIEELEVTNVLQALIQNSQLALNVKSFCELLGFYDVAPSKPKELELEYEFRNQKHHVVVRDGQILCIPEKSHLL